MFDLSQIMSAEDAAMVGGVLAFYGVILCFSFILGIVTYIFQSIGLFKMAKNLGFKHCWMAWIPLLNTYTFGKIGSKYVKKSGKASAKFGGWLIGLEIAMNVMLIAMIIALVFFVIGAVALLESGAAEPTTEMLGSVLAVVLTSLGISGISIAYTVIFYIALWRIFAIFDNSCATVFLVISIIFPITYPFFIFAVRNNKPCVTYEERIGFVPQTVQPQPVAELPVAEETVSEETEEENATPNE